MHMVFLWLAHKSDAYPNNHTSSWDIRDYWNTYAAHSLTTPGVQKLSFGIDEEGTCF